MKEKNTVELKKIANSIRQDIIKMLVQAGSGHSAGPLGLADIFTALYFCILNHRPKQPLWPDRDRLFLSCGHNCPVLYATLAQAGYFPREELSTLRQTGTRLQGHPHIGELPGVENTSGPLGQGLSQAFGAALAAKMDHKKHRIFVISSDGEQDEGQTWEALMFAGKMKLSNVTVILDRNNIQIDGPTERVMPLEPLREKYEAFGWHVIEVDGHNIPQVIHACNESRAIAEKPTMIIAHTIPGKDVSFMESNYLWHGSPPNKEQAEAALKELKKIREQILSECTTICS